MKTYIYICSLAVGILLSGCSRSDGPVIKGEVVRCLLWDKPRPRQGETGSSSYETFTSGRIEIYEHFIVVTETNGVKHVAPHDWYSEVRFK